MAAMAGALRIELEKIGHYSLGDACEHASIEKCEVAISIMKCTAIVFYILFSIPLIMILHIVGWWTMIFGA
jgi:adenosylcobinamide-phosphate synthase